MSFAHFAMLIVLLSQAFLIHAAAATISASPNPVLVSSKSAYGTTTIAWSTEVASTGEVYVSLGQAAEQLFARGASGSQPAPWIGPDADYTFRLYSVGPQRQLLASVLVRATIGEKTRPVALAWLLLGVVALGAAGYVYRRRLSGLRRSRKLP